MGDELKQEIIDFWKKHPGKMAGVLLGFIIGVLVLVIGFFQTLFLVACTAAGLWLGVKYDNSDIDWLQRLNDIKLPNQLKLK